MASPPNFQKGAAEPANPAENPITKILQAKKKKKKGNPFASFDKKAARGDAIKARLKE